MPVIHLIDGLDLKMARGSYNLHGELLQPCYMDGESKGCRVPLYLSQGSLDGACGIYSLLTALTVAGAFESAEEQERSLSRGIGNLAEEYELGPMLSDGLNITQLRKFLSAFDSNEGGWKLDRVAGKAGTISQFRGIVNALMSSPVILAIPGHWTVAIGWELYRTPDDFLKPGIHSAPSDLDVDRLLLVDPSQAIPAAVYWNAVLTRANPNGPPRFHYSGARYTEKTEIVTAYQLRRSGKGPTRRISSS